MARYETSDRGPGAAYKPWAGKTVENQEVVEPGPALRAMMPDLFRIETLLEGTDAMREAAQEYLPQHEYESDHAYGKRLAVCYLDNYTLRTLDTLVGKAFKDAPAPGEDMPEPIVSLLDDVDDAGTALVPFAREWFRQGVKSAVAHVLVDATAPAPTEDGKTRTLADDLKSGMRPQWRLIPALDMLDVQVAKVNGKMRPVLVRFRDNEVRPSGLFGSEIVQCVKVLRQEGNGVTWERWELQKAGKGKKEKWVQVVPPSPFGLPVIPLVTFYTDKTGTAEGRSKLSDLGHLNVRHWQSTADQTNALTVSRFPILAASGVRDVEGDDGSQIVVGPNKFLTTPDPQSKIYFVEAAGTAIDKGSDELNRLEKAMASYGAQFLEKGAQGPETASGRVLDEAEAISPLQSWGLDFKDCLTLACYFTALWLKLTTINDNGFETPIDFDVDPEINLADPTELQSLEKARDRKDISRKAYLNELLVRGVIKQEGYDIDEDQEEIDDEAPPPGTGLDGMTAGLAGVKPGQLPTKAPAIPPKKPAAPKT